MIINPKLFDLQESATLRINNLALQKRAAGQPVFHFGFGQSPFPVPTAMQQMLKQNTDKKAYMPGLGLPELRHTIAQFLHRYFDYDLKENNIAVGPGSKELLFDLLYILEGTVLIPSPSWVSYKPIAQLLGKKVAVIHTDFAKQFKLTSEQLEEAVTSNPDQQYILILNSPSNPTGQQYTLHELEAIANLCRQHNIHVISDEIYALIDFAQTQSISVGASIQHLLPEQSYVTGGLSKAFCAGGWRLGFITYQDLRVGEALQTLISETFSCVSAPTQHAAITAFQMGKSIQLYLQETKNILRIVGTYCHQQLNDMQVQCHPASGGFYLFIDFEHYRGKLEKHGIQTAKQWCDYLLDTAGIALLPGVDFGRRNEEISARLAFVDFDGQQLLDAYRADPHAFSQNVAQHVPQIRKGLECLKQTLEDI